MSKITATVRAGHFPNEGLEVRNKKLWCTRCNVEVLFERKHTVTTHIDSQKHKKISGAVAGNSKITSSGTINELDTQWNSMTSVFVGAGIALHVFRYKPLREFLKRYLRNGHALPSESSLRSRLEAISVTDLNITKEICKGKDICITLDETTDTKNRKVLNILVKLMEPGSKSRLFRTKIIERCTADVMEQEVISAVLDLGCTLNNLLILSSDNAPYMVLAGENLSRVCHRMTHSTCWSHVLHLVSEEVRSSMPEADQLIAKIKSAFTKAPSRREEYFGYLVKHGKKPRLPPVPVITRWGTWLEAGDAHWENLSVIQDWIKNTKEKSSLLASLKTLFIDNADLLASQLERIHQICPGLTGLIKQIEGNDMIASDLWNNLQILDDYLKCLGLPSAKLKLYLNVKHPALKFWEDVQVLDPRKCPENIHEGIPQSLQKFTNDPVPLAELLLYKNLSQYEVSATSVNNPIHFWQKYSSKMKILSSLALKALLVPASSADVERSFSFLKKLLSPQRMGLLPENISSHLRVAFNNDFMSTDIDPSQVE